MGLEDYYHTLDLIKYEFDAAVAWDRIEGYLKQFQLESILANPRLLYLGCGKGVFLDFLTKEGIPAVGIDIHSQPHRDKPNALFVIGDVQQMPFKDGSFNIVFSRGLFDPRMYPNDRTKLMSEAARVLIPGGAYFIQDFDHPETSNVPGFKELMNIEDEYSMLLRV